MKTPVLIAAYNEEKRIAPTLKSLPSELVEPIVIVNGSNDNTAEIARSFGVQTFEVERRGKLPAIQYALQTMGARALEPLFILDADTRPVFPTLWQKHMLAALQPDDAEPRTISAPVWFTPNSEKQQSNLGTAVSRSIYRQAHGALTRLQNKGESAYYGPNEGYKLANQETLDAVVGLENFWPQEDVAVAHTVQANGGSFQQLIDPRVIAKSPESVAFSPLLHYITKPTQVHLDVEAAYRRNAPGDSKPYSRP